MIVVTGAAGQLGGAIVDGLLMRLPAGRIAASVRDPAKAAALAQRGVSVRAGDFADPGALQAAFAGADQVLIVSVNQVGEAALRLHRVAIEAARAAGARRVLYTSHMGARADSLFAPAADHAATEALLAEGGGAFTALRHGFYAESALHLIGNGWEAGEIRAPEDGPVSWTARADLAEADAILLAGEAATSGRAVGAVDAPANGALDARAIGAFGDATKSDRALDGITPPLTAPEAFTMAELAAIASELSGREIKRVVVSDDEWREAKVAQGVPAPMAEMLLGAFRAARRGDFAAVDPTLGALLGRRPRTMRDVLGAIFKPAAG